MVTTVYREQLFQGKVALVTGGGTGIGLRTAQELSKLGAVVLIASRNQEHLDQALPQIKAQGGGAESFICNVRSEASVQECITAILKKYSKIDFLVNNAGGQFPAPAETITKKGWDAVLETNLTGPFLMARECFNRCFVKQGGAIVNVIANIWRGFPMMAHTGAARAGVDNLTKTLAWEWGRYGVRVNAVAPGIIHSSGLDSYHESFQKVAHDMKRHNQANRLGTEAEVAAAILFLFTPAAAFITGETLRVDGGDSLYSPSYPPVAHDKIPPFGGEDE